jgi:hypothetical protein
MAGPAPTTSQLRNKIDSGLAGSKIEAPDPAAAPLGTDDEAAGTSPSAEAVRMAMRHEVETTPNSAGEDRLDAGVPIYLLILAGIVAAIGVMGVILL